jgi:NTP pyrophosphatase (non-canonical NTP hydrolase)
MNKEQFEKVTTWQDAVFTKATPLSCVYHLTEEVNELKEDIIKNSSCRSEVADCFLLLFAVANKLGMDYDSIVKAIDDKMEVNYNRKWGDVNEQGYVKHLKI